MRDDDEEKAAILAEARANAEQPRYPESSTLDRWERQRPAEPEVVFKTRELFRRAAGHRCHADMGNVGQRALAQEREFLLQVMGEALAEYVRRANKAAKSELEDAIRSLRIELCAMDQTVAELRKAITAENTRVIDLPGSPLAPRRVN
jgi:hypothetical protein